MILTGARDIERYRASGLWGHLALDELFLFAARKAPDQIALVDPPDRAGFTGGAPRRLTWGEAAAAVESLAGQFLSLGLKADDIVAVQLPNTVESCLVLLALFRARLIACPLPPAWREHELNAALAQIAPRGLVTAGRIGAFGHADMMCHVAGEQMSVRHVLAFGDTLPDGVIPLGAVPAADGDSGPDLPGHRSDAANHVATMTFESFGAAVPRPIARSHNQWIAAALRHTAVAGLKRSDIILSAHLPVGLLPLSAVFVPWLLTGARLVLHQPFDRAGFLAALLDSAATYTLLPAGVLAALEEDGFDWSRTAVGRVGCVWGAPHQAHAAGQTAPAAGALPVNDLYAFGEIATYAGARAAGHRPGRIPLGAIGIADEDDAPAVLETRVRGGGRKAGDGESALAGTLQVRGAMVPALDLGPAEGRLADAAEATADDEAPFVDTGIRMLICSAEPPAADCLSEREGVVHVGGLAVAVAELDQLLAGHSAVAEAAAYALPDPLLGTRIEAAVVTREGAGVSSEDMRTYLKSRKVAEHKLPARTVRVGAIPRDADGRIDRHRLAQHGA